jgi:acyl dehydratase
VIYYEDVHVGDALATLDLAALSEADLASYAAASGDDNPLHTDPEHARAAGMGGVIAHGMLVMGYLGRVAAALAGPAALRRFQVRFRDPTRPGEALRCGGQVRAVYEQGGEGLVAAELWVRAADGALKASGSMLAALPRRPGEPAEQGQA